MKTNVNTHVKNIHHVTKRTHELFKNSKICNYTNALLLILILSIAILATQMFLNNQNKVVPDAEIRFSELSKDKKILGTIIPASCQSGIWLTNPDPTIPHNDGQIESNCLPLPPATATCWDGSIITPSLGQSCPSQYCGVNGGAYTGTMEGYDTIQNNKFNRCTCNTGEAKRVRTDSTAIDTNNTSQCTPVVSTLAHNNIDKVKKTLMTLLPEKAYAGPIGPICLVGRYAVCVVSATPPTVNIRFE